MNTHGNANAAHPVLLEEDTASHVVRALGLHVAQHPQCPRAQLVRKRAGSAPIAAILEQGETFRDDKRSILAMKAADRDLPIIYVASSAQARREMAIRRLCIHYFLAHSADRSELRLVLEALVRAAVTHTSYERFFTR